MKQTREQLEREVKLLREENKNLRDAAKRYSTIVKKTRVRPRYRNTGADIMSRVVYLERLIKDRS